MDIEYWLIPLISAIVSGIIFGFITRAINRNKGYEGGFSWGFFLGWIGIIVVCCKPSITSTSAPTPSLIKHDDEAEFRAKVQAEVKKELYRILKSEPHIILEALENAKNGSPKKEVSIISSAADSLKPSIAPMINCPVCHSKQRSNRERCNKCNALLH